MTETPDQPPTPPGGDADRGPDGAQQDAPERETAYALLQRGQALLESRHYAQAAVVLERAARLEPRKGSILEALGRAYYNSAQHQRAQAAFAALVEIDPTSHYGHYALGQSLKHLGLDHRAWTHLKLAVALAPTNALYRGALQRMPAPQNRDPKPPPIAG